MGNLQTRVISGGKPPGGNLQEGTSLGENPGGALAGQNQVENPGNPGGNLQTRVISGWETYETRVISRWKTSSGTSPGEPKARVISRWETYETRAYPGGKPPGSPLGENPGGTSRRNLQVGNLQTRVLSRWNLQGNPRGPTNQGHIQVETSGRNLPGETSGRNPRAEPPGGKPTNQGHIRVGNLRNQGHIQVGNLRNQGHIQVEPRKPR